MTTVTLQQAQANLPALIEHLAAGEELLITQGARPVAKLTKPEAAERCPVFGRGRGKVIILADDDEHLQGFEAYMP